MKIKLDNSKKTKNDIQSKRPSESLRAATEAAIKSAEQQRKLMKKIAGNYQSQQVASFIRQGSLGKTFEDLAKNSIINLEKSIRLAYVDKILSYNKAVERLIRDPILEAQKSLRHFWIDQAEKINHQMNAILKDPLADLRVALESTYADSFLAMQKKMVEIAKVPYQQMHKFLESSSYMDNLADIQKGLRRITDLAVALPKFDFVVTAENTFVYEDKLYDLDDIQGIIEETITKYKKASLDEETFLNGINRLITEIQKIKEPFIQRIIISILCPIIVWIIISFFNPLIDEIRDHLFIKDKRSAVKTVQQTIAKTEIPKNLLFDYRFVSADVLNVRSENNRKSMIVGKLYFGQIVNMIQKKKDWTLVEWQDNDGEVTIRGWVFTRYLKKFRN